MSPEPRTNRTLSAEDVRAEAVETLSALLPNEIAGYRATGTMLLEVLIYAATEGTSLHGACALLDGVADDTTLRGYLNAAFPKSKVDALSRGGKTVVLSSVPEVVFERRQRVAIDLKDFAYYGKDGSLGMWLNRCKATAGTTRCLRAATAYVVRNGERVTLAATLVSAGQTLGEVVRELTGHLRFQGVKIESLYLDRGFASVEVIRTLRQMRVPAIIACPIRGSATSGVRQYCTGRASKTVQHTFVSKKYGSVAATVALARSTCGGSRSPRKIRWLAYIVVGQQLKPLAVRDRYRCRFGIETSYRLLNQIRPRTTSRNPAVRLLMILIGVVLQNLWVKLKRQVGLRSLPPRGFRLDATEYVDDRLFRLTRFKAFLRHALERRYPPRLTIPLPPVATT